MEVTITLTLPIEKAAELTAWMHDVNAASEKASEMRSSATNPPPVQNSPTPPPTAAPAPALAQMFPPMSGTQSPMIPTAPPPVLPAQQNPVQPEAQPSTTPKQLNAVPPTTIPVQSAPQAYAAQDLALAARPLMEMGRQAELRQLLNEFGAATMTAIPENRRAEFASRLRAMGGQI